MRRGFAIQQQSRFLSSLTVHQRDGQLRRFAAWTNEYPWRWRAQDVEEWTAVRWVRNAGGDWAGYVTGRGQ